MRDQPAAAAPDAATVPPAAARPQFDPELATLMVTKRGCDDRMPGFREKVAADYARWRQKNLQRVAVTERSPEFARQLDDARKQRAAANSMGAPDYVSKECDRIAAVLEKSAGPEPGLATPEGAFKVFVDAVRRGDAAAALRCMGGTARDEYRRAFQQMQAKGMRDFANTLRSLRVTQTSATDSSGVISKANGTEGRVVFQKFSAEWRIVEL